MKRTLMDPAVSEVLSHLRDANLAFAAREPGESGARQPVHVVYGGAHLFRADTARKLGALALRSLREHFPTPVDLASTLGLEHDAAAVYARVVKKLEAEAVEDFRVDFEDGYGHRPDDEEDAHALAAAAELARGAREGTLPPFVGIRVKPLGEELRERSVRTLDLFVTALARELGGALPPNFVVTLPKVQTLEQAGALAVLLELLEQRLSLAAGSLKLELMVETPRAIVASDGTIPLASFVRAARGRCVGVHFGTYDYTAALGITAAHQAHVHAACDFARSVMQVALAGTGVFVSDGATTLLPIAPHRAGGGATLTPEQELENRGAIRTAAKLHYDNVRHSLRHGFYQGWDLHPAQLPARYAAVFSFFLEALGPATVRLRNFMERAAQATELGGVFDDAATGQGLLNFFLRGVACGALSDDDVRATGLTPEELRTRSFARIVAGRR